MQNMIGPDNDLPPGAGLIAIDMDACRAALLSVSFAAALLSPLASLHAQVPPAAAETEEIVVIGRQPGPPLWRVASGDHVLWIFPYLSTVPKGMVWESDKTEDVIAGSQAMLAMPRVSASVSNVGVLLNPINLFRGYRLVKRVTRNPDGKSLMDVVPADSYTHFASLKARYFPRDAGIEELRPIAAAASMVDHVHGEEGLKDGRDILGAIERMARRNKKLERSEVNVETAIDGNFGVIAGRVETLADSLDPDAELACFDALIERMTNDLDAIKRLANAWARGDADELRMARRDDEARCNELLMTSSEAGLLEALEAERDRRWLEAAEHALATHASTFAILPVEDLVAADGVLAVLRDRGYAIREP